MNERMNELTHVLTNDEWSGQGRAEQSEVCEENQAILRCRVSRASTAGPRHHHRAPLIFTKKKYRPCVIYEKSKKHICTRSLQYLVQ